MQIGSCCHLVDLPLLLSQPGRAQTPRPRRCAAMLHSLSPTTRAGALVNVRLLGPFAATVGQPTTLCWRLERCGQAEAQPSATRIGFEVQAEVRATADAPLVSCYALSQEPPSLAACLPLSLLVNLAPSPHTPASPLQGDHWRPLGRHSGSVLLAGHDGAAATLEVTWVPLAAGLLPVPALALPDVDYQVCVCGGGGWQGEHGVSHVCCEGPCLCRGLSVYLPAGL